MGLREEEKGGKWGKLGEIGGNWGKMGVKKRLYTYRYNWYGGK
jgi:hypothetical protein